MGELGSVAVGVLLVMTRRVITIPLRGSEAYLPRQVRRRRWAWGLERCDFGGEAEVCEYAPDRERACDRGEQRAVPVAVWAAHHVLVEYASDKLGPAIRG